MRLLSLLTLRLALWLMRWAIASLERADTARHLA